MRRLVTILSLVFLVSLVVSQVSANFTWPNWQLVATSYPDSTFEAGVSGREDMTICYVYKDASYVYFRVERRESRSDFEIVVTIFLDVDQNQATGKTGTDNSLSLHDLGAEYKILLDITFVVSLYIYKWGGVGWGILSTAGSYTADDSYNANIAIPLTTLANPTFPIDILFVCHYYTDYNPDTTHITYPSGAGTSTPVPVGGQIKDVSTLELIASYLQSIAPYLLTFAIVAVVGAGILAIKRSSKRQITK